LPAVTVRSRRRASGPLVTLASDLGATYAAQMRAVLLARLPAERVVDLTHDLRPHAIGEAAFVLRPIVARFPAGAVHVVVVDPGVGGRRRPLVILCRDGSRFVGPDNGVLAPLVEARGGGRAFVLDPARLRGEPRIGTTFDGRDLFAPAAAALARGASPHRLGSRTVYHPLDRPAPSRRPGEASGTVAHIDRFGNVLTDIPSAWVPPSARSLEVRLGGRVRRLPRVTSYEQAGKGRLAVLGSSFGTLEVALAEGRASDRLRVALEAPVRLRWRAPRARPARPNRK